MNRIPFVLRKNVPGRIPRIALVALADGDGHAGKTAGISEDTFVD